MHIAEETPKWRWLLVVPAFIVGWVFPGLVWVIWKFIGGSWIFGLDTVVFYLLLILQHGASGSFAVYFSSRIAPSSQVTVGLGSGIAVAVIAAVLWIPIISTGSSGTTITLDTILLVIRVAAASITAYGISKKRLI